MAVAVSPNGSIVRPLSEITNVSASVEPDMSRDFLPRSFQADCYRFYTRVIRNTLGELPVHSDVQYGVFTSQTEFLENCEKATSNLVAYEARRSFALTLSALFERQLRMWARVHFPTDQTDDLKKMPFSQVLETVVELQDLGEATSSLHATIYELHLLANAVRHGDGPSAEKLWALSPRFWRQVTVQPAPSERSELIQITDDDFVGYIRTIVRFWGLADREPFAVVDGGPY
jgi:hypothetical protein